MIILGPINYAGERDMQSDLVQELIRYHTLPDVRNYHPHTITTFLKLYEIDFHFRATELYGWIMTEDGISYDSVYGSHLELSDLVTKFVE